MDETQQNQLMQFLLLNSLGGGSGGDVSSAFLTPEQRRRQAAILGGAAAFDIGQGIINRRRAEEDIEEGAALRDDVIDAIKDVRARDTAALTPEARRNAAILLSNLPAEDSDNLAAAREALEFGADPSKVQRVLSESEAADEEREINRQTAALMEGLRLARLDEQAAINKIMSDLGLDYQTAQEMIAMGQQQSLMGQQQSGAGFRNALNAALRFAMSRQKKKDGEEVVDDEGKTLLTGEKDGKTFILGGRRGTSEDQILDFGEMGDIIPQYQQNLDLALREDDVEGFLNALTEFGDMTVEGDQGMVIKTPGEFSHDTNPIDIIREGKKIGEMTGGEYVINPEQASGMEKAYNKAKKNKSRANLMDLFNAVRFIDEPQFD